MGAMDTNPPDARTAELIARVLQIKDEVDSFNRRWPAEPGGDPAPAFTWADLERQLVELAPSDLQAELVRALVKRVRTYAALRPPEMVLREILRIAALVLDESDLPDAGAP